MAAPPVIARTATYHHTRIGRTELDKLLLVVGDAAPAGTVSAMCTVGNAQLQEDSLDDLIAARAALPYVSTRTPWDNLTLERDEGAAKFVGIEFKDGVVTVTVRSVDPIWTHGQMHRLGEILEEAHGRTKPKVHRYEVQRGIVLILGPGAMLCLNVWWYTARGHMFVVEQVAMCAFLASGIWLLAKEWLDARSSRPVFKVTEDVQWGSAWSRLSNADRIGAIGAGFAGLAAIAAVLALI
ncbi:hypothetical protein [Streptomyces sp. B1-3]|uniref:hypothetical protein n=1 Tax=Streptomyces sp. B1-3 TaxID=3141453 RepID=UPI003D26E51E